MNSPAGRFGACGVERRRALLDVFDAPFFGDDKRGAIGETALRDQDSVGCGDFSVGEVAQQRKGQFQFFRKFFLGRDIVGADPEYFRIRSRKIGQTSLVGQEFLRSTTRERGREKSQDHIFLAAEIR